MTKVSARRLAQLVLDQVDLDDSYVNLALQRVLNEHESVERREKNFATELVYGTMRQLYKLDFILGRLLSRPLKTLKPTIKNTLRLALYQLIFLPEVPERAVCHAAVELIKDSPYNGLAKLVNAVLRNYLRQRADLPLPNRESDLVKYLSIEYSHPNWLIERWLNRFGPVKAEQLLAIDNEIPPLTLRVNLLLADSVTVRRELEEQGVTTVPGRFLKEALILKKLPQSLEEMALFQNGKVFAQDENAMLAAHLVAPVNGELILDLCAAPGGKSTHLAEQMQDQGSIISIDDHAHKIELIKQNATRLHLQSIHSQLADARSFKDPDGRLFDAVLLDVPCSGTGVLRRRVDARYRRQPEDITKLAALQREILKNAATLVRSGGRLVYTTCTLEPEENQAQIQWFIQEYPEFKVTDWRGFLPANLEEVLEDRQSKWATILPVSSGGDGFFICRMEKG
jgi:16S rRNA (cytosine967-C5)-methyltransferase